MDKHGVYPRPQWLRERPGEAFRLNTSTPILATGASCQEAQQLQAWLRQDYGLDLSVQEPGQGKKGILIGRLADQAVQGFRRQHGIVTDGREAVGEGYLLVSAQDGILVAGFDAPGTCHGLQTLRQLITLDGAEPSVPGIEMHDWPYKAMRGVHLYMPGRQQIPFFRRLLEFLAALKLNLVMLEVGAGMRYDRHPEINRGWEEFVAAAMAFPDGPRGLQRSQRFPKDSTHTELAGGSFLEKAEVSELLGYARSLHIDVIPEVPSLSHAYYLCWPHREIAERLDDPFPDTFCPSNPASYELLFDVMEEVIEVFQPRIVHAGHDEVYHYGLCPRCQGKSGADLLAGDITCIHDFLAARGIRMAMWGDKLMNIIVGGAAEGGRVRHARRGPWFQGDDYVMGETYPAVEQIPKDILILDWYWELDPSSQRYFGQKGFEEVFGNFGQNFGPHTFRGWERRASAEHVLGAEVSTWCDASEYALGRNACLFNLMFSSGMLWWRHYSDRERGHALETIAEMQPRVRDQLGARRSPSLALGTSKVCFPLAGATPPPFAGNLPCGKVELMGVPFSLTGGVRVGSDNPESRAIAVGKNVASLLFLHACGGERQFRPTWDFPDPRYPSAEDLLGWYRILYADGSEVQAEIRYGENIARWDLRFGEDIAACCYWAEPAWEGYDEEGRLITLYHYEWINPAPQKTIQSVHCKWAPGGGEITLLALTGVQAKGSLPAATDAN